MSLVCSSPDGLFGEIFDKGSFSGSDLRLDRPGMFPLVSLSIALCLQGAVGEDNILFVIEQGQERIFHLDHKVKSDLE